MPAARKSNANPSTELATLPRRNGLVIVGGKRPIGILIHEGNQMIQPELALWLDEQSGFIFGSDVINPSGGSDASVRAALDALVNIIRAPFDPAPRTEAEPSPGTGKRKNGKQPPALPHLGLPDAIKVNDAALAEAARALFAPLDVPVEYNERLPAFDEAYAAAAQYMGANPDGLLPEPFSWEIAPALLPPLYKAANAYARLAPWRYLPDHPAIAIALGDQGPEPGVEALYACILGGAGMVFGVAFYFTLDDVRRAAEGGQGMSTEDEEIDARIAQMRLAGMPVDDIPYDRLHDMVRDRLAEERGETLNDTPPRVGDSLVVFLDKVGESDPTYLDWLAERGIRYSGSQYVPSAFRAMRDGEIRDLTARETTALTLGLAALNQFLRHAAPILSGPYLPAAPLVYQARIGTGARRTIAEVRFPPTW